MDDYPSKTDLRLSFPCHEYAMVSTRETLYTYPILENTVFDIDAIDVKNDLPNARTHTYYDSPPCLEQDFNFPLSLGRCSTAPHQMCQR